MLRLALPSKGEMEEPTLEFLRSCGLRVQRANPRQYSATIEMLPDSTVLFQRAPDIPAKVAEGSVDLGITGYDTVRELAREGDDVVVILENLGYSRCELVLAVPDGWVDVSSMADLVDLAFAFRERGRELRIATKYPRLVRQFLFQKGISAFTLVESKGALEAAPAMGYADLIADLTSSGTTLRENHLKTIAGGTILRSQACLIGNRRLLRQSPAKLALVRTILELIEARTRGEDFYRLTANIPGDSAEAVAMEVLAKPELAGLAGPTVSPVYTSGPGAWFNVAVVVPTARLLQAVAHLRSIGATGISVQSVKYVFAAESHAFRQLVEQLGLEPAELVRLEAVS